MSDKVPLHSHSSDFDQEITRPVRGRVLQFEERSRTMTKGVASVMTKLRCVLTLTVLFGALILAGPVGAMDAFLPANIKADGAITTNGIIGGASAVLGAFPVSQTHGGVVDNGEAGWSEADDANIGNPDGIGASWLTNKSALNYARSMVAGGMTAENAIVGNLQGGDKVVLVGVFQGASAADLDTIRAGGVASATLIQMVTADYYGAGAATYIGKQLAYAASNDITTATAIYPNKVTGVVAPHHALYAQLATVALFVWDPDTALTDVNGLTYAVGSMVVAATADTSTTNGYKVDVTVNVTASRAGMTPADGRAASTQVGIDHTGPEFAVGTPANVYGSAPLLTVLDANGVNVDTMPHFNGKSFEIRSADTLIISATVITNVTLDGEPDAYFGVGGSDPLNDAIGTGLAVGAAANIVANASVSPRSFVPLLEQDGATTADLTTYSPASEYQNLPATPVTNQTMFDPTFMEASDSFFFGSGNTQAGRVLSASVVVTIGSIVQGADIIAANDAAGGPTIGNNASFYHGIMMLSASYVVTDIPTPQHKDNGKLSMKWYLGDELGFNGNAWTAGKSTNSSVLSYDRALDTRPPYVAEVELGNSAAASGYSGPLILGGQHSTLGLGINVDRNGDPLSDQKDYILSFVAGDTTRAALTDPNGGDPSQAPGAILLVSNTTLTFVELDHILTGASPIDGASFTTFLNPVVGDANTITSASLTVIVTDDARNVTTFISHADSSGGTSGTFNGGAISGQPPLATFTIDNATPLIQYVTANFYQILTASGYPAASGGDTVLLSMLRKYPVQAPYSGNSSYTQVANGANVAAVTMGTIGGNIELQIGFDPVESGSLDDLVADWALNGNTTATGGTATDVFGFGQSKGSFAVEVILRATNGAMIEKTLTPAVMASSIADLNSASVVVRVSVPADIVSAVVNNPSMGRTNVVSYIPGGVTNASFYIKITDRVGNYAGYLNPTDKDAVEAAKNNYDQTHPTNNDEGKKIVLHLEPPSVGNQPKEGTVWPTATGASQGSFPAIYPVTNTLPVLNAVAGNVVFWATSTPAPDYWNGTQPTAQYVDPISGVQWGTSAPANFVAEPYRLRAAADKQTPLYYQYGTDANTGNVRGVLGDVEVGEILIVSVTITPPHQAGLADLTSAASYAQGWGSPLADKNRIAFDGSFDFTEAYDYMKHMITADFSMYNTGYSSVIAAASAILRGGSDGMVSSDWIGTATAGDIVLATFIHQVTSSNLVSLNGTTIRVVTVTARSPYGPSHSLAIGGATADFGENTLAIKSMKFGKTAASLTDVAAASLGSATVGINHVVQVVGELTLGGSIPGYEASNTYHVSLDMQDFGGTSAVPASVSYCVDVYGGFNSVGSANHSVSELIAAATKVQVSWEVSLDPTATGWSAVATSDRTAKVIMQATTSGLVNSTTASNAGILGGPASDGLLQVDTVVPTVNSLELITTAAVNTSGPSDKLTDTNARPGDTMQLYAKIAADNGTIVNGQDVNYDFALDLSEFGVDSAQVTRALGLASATELNVTWTFTVNSGSTLTVDTAYTAQKASILQVTDQVDNNVGRTDTSTMFIEYYAPKPVNNSSHLVAQVKRDVMNLESRIVNDAFSNVTGGVGNADRGVVDAFVILPPDTQGHREAVGNADVILVTAAIPTNDAVGTEISVGNIKLDMSDFFDVANMIDLATTLQYAAPSDTGAPFIQAVSRTGNPAGTSYVTWQIKLPSAIPASKLKDAPDGGRVKVYVKDDAGVSSTTTDNATVEVDPLTPSVNANFTYIREDGSVYQSSGSANVGDGLPISGVTYAINKVTMQIMVAADYTSDYPSTVLGATGTAGAVTDPGAIGANNVSSVISVDLSAYGFDNSSAFLPKNPTATAISIQGSNYDSVIITEASTLAEIRNVTGNRLVAGFWGSPDWANYAKITLPQANLTSVVTSAYSIPGYAIADVTPWTVDGELVVSVYDRVGNVGTANGSPDLDNSPPWFERTLDRNLAVANYAGATVTVVGGGSAVGEGGQVQISFGIQDPGTNTSPIEVEVNLTNLGADYANCTIGGSDYTNLSEAPVISEGAAGDKRVMITNIKPDAAVGGMDFSYVTMTVTIPAGAASGKKTAGNDSLTSSSAYVTLNATDALNITTLATTYGIGNQPRFDGNIESAPVKLDVTEPYLLAMETMSVGASWTGSAYDTGNLTQASNPPSVAPGTLVLVSSTWASDSLDIDPITDLAVVVDSDLDTSGAVTSGASQYAQVGGWSAAARGVGNDKVYWVTTLIQIDTNAQHIQPQPITTTVKDDLGQLSKTASDDMGINAVGVLINSVKLTVNGVDPSVSAGNVGGNGPDTAAPSTALDELAAGDVVVVTARVSIFDAQTPTDLIKLDASKLFPTKMAGISADLVPSASSFNQSTGVLTAVWEKCIIDFNGNRTSDLEVFLPRQSLWTTGTTAGSRIAGIAQQVYGNGVAFGVGKWVTTTVNVNVAANDNPAATDNQSYKGAPYYTVQADTASATETELLVTAQDSGAADLGYAAFEMTTPKFAIDTQAPNVTFTIAYVNSQNLTLEDGWPETPQSETEDVNGNAYDRVKNGDTITITANVINPLIPASGTNYPGDDQAKHPSTGVIGDIASIIEDATIDLSDFTTDSSDLISVESGSSSTFAGQAGSETQWQVTWTVKVNQSSDRYEAGTIDTYSFKDDAGNQDAALGTPNAVGVDNTAPYIDPDSLVAYLLEGTFTPYSGGVAGTPVTVANGGTPVTISNDAAIAAESIIRVSFSFTEPIDAPTDILSNQFGDLTLYAPGLPTDSAPGGVKGVLDNDLSTGSPSSFFAIYTFTMPSAADAPSSDNMQFVISATDTVGNNDETTPAATYKYDGKPDISITHANSPSNGSAVDPIVLPITGSAYDITAVVTDLGGVTGAGLITGGDLAAGVSAAVVSGEGTSSANVSTSFDPTVGAGDVVISVTGSDAGQTIQSASVYIHVNANPTLAATAADGDAVNIPLTFVEDAANGVQEATIEINEGETITITTVATDGNVADTITLAPSGDMFAATNKQDAKFNAGYDLYPITGTGGTLSADVVFVPGYEAIDTPAIGLTDQPTLAVFDVILKATDGVLDAAGTVADATTRLIVRVTQAAAIPELSILAIEVDGVDAPYTINAEQTTQDAERLALDITNPVPEESVVEIHAQATDMNAGLFGLLNGTEAIDSEYGAVDFSTAAQPDGSIIGSITFTPTAFAFNNIDTAADPLQLVMNASATVDSDVDGDVDADDVPSTGTLTVDLEISNVSQPPVLTLTLADAAVLDDPGIDTDPDTTLALTLVGTDADGSILQLAQPSLLEPVDGITIDTLVRGDFSAGESTGTFNITVGSLTQNTSAKLVIGVSESVIVSTVRVIPLLVSVFDDAAPTITLNPTSLTFDEGSSQTVTVTVDDTDTATITSLTAADVTGLTVTEDSTLSAANQMVNTYTVASSAAGSYSVDFTATSGSPALTATANLPVTVDAVSGDVVKATVGIVIATKHGAPAPGFMVLNPDGSTQRSKVILTSSTAEVFVGTGDFNGDGIESVLVGYGRRDLGLTNGPGSVLSMNAMTGSADVPSMVPFPFEHPTNFDNNPTGEVRIAAGNLIGDASDEAIVIQGANAQSRLRIAGVQPDGTFANIDANSFRASQLGNPDNGIAVITADLDGDGFDEIIASVASMVDFGAGGGLEGNWLQAMNIASAGSQTSTAAIPGTDIQWSPKQQIFGAASNPSGAMRMAAGDLDGDGNVEIVVVSATPDPTDAATLGNSKLSVLVPTFTDGDFANGSFAAMKDNSGAGNNISVKLFSTATNPSGDMSVACADLDGDGKDEIMITRGVSVGATVSKSDVTIFYFDQAGIGDGVLARLPKEELPSVFGVDSNPSGGANVAASAALPTID